MSQLKAFVQAGHSYNVHVPSMLRSLGFQIVLKMEECDVVVLTGGADINPALYGQGKHFKTYPDTTRDEVDVKAYYQALSLGKPLIGICRGAQLLHVFNGGDLYQDVDGHRYSHAVKCHGIKPPKEGVDPTVTSTHHQMMVLPPASGKVFENNPHELLLSAEVSTFRDYTPQGELTKVNTANNHIDVEAIFYKNTSCLCFQGHPEYTTGNTDTLYLFKECLKKCFGWEFKG